MVKLIALAEGQEEVDPDWPLVLKAGERLVSTVQGAGLFEPRREPGHWSGRSAGVSVPVPDTRLRVRVGKSAGTYIQGAEEPTVIDTGNVSITTQRVVFQGGKYTREWDYSKLIGVVHYSDKPATAIQVSNREKTSGIVYAGVDSTEPLHLAMTVAIAIYRGEAEETITELKNELANLDAESAASDSPASASQSARQSDSHPPAPTSEPAGGQAPSADVPQTSGPAAMESPPALPPPMWAADPSGRHQFRFWNGNAWTEHVSDRGHSSDDPPPPGPT
jgi:hypothetical protein